MAYLDWSKSEEDRIQTVVETEAEGEPPRSRRRCSRDLGEG
jgi:hypothetical protein